MVTFLNEIECTFIYVQQKNSLQEMIQIILNLVMSIKEFLQYALVINLLKLF